MNTVQLQPLPSWSNEPVFLTQYRQNNQKVFQQSPLQKSVYAKLSLWSEALSNWIPSKSQVVRPQELEIHGVEVLSWKQALELHADLIQKGLIFEEMPKDQFHALANAYFSDGFVLVLPTKDHVTIEFRTQLEKNQVQKNMIIVPKGVKKVKIIEQVENPSGFGILSETLLAQEDCEVEWVRLNEIPEKSQTLNYSNVIALKDSTVLTSAVWKGNGTIRTRQLNRLHEEGSHIDHRDAVIAFNKAHFDLNSLSLHAAPNAFSHVIIKGILRDESVNVFDGMIKVLPVAQQTNALLECHQMLLSQEAKSNSIPGLEIEADDVKCTHKATIVHIEPEELFYVQSRGIPKKVAEESIAKSFIESNFSTLSEEAKKAVTVFMNEERSH